MEIRFDGKTVLVTGAGRGIGSGIAKGFAANGANVVLSDVNEENLKKVCQEITDAGGKATYMLCDITDVKQVDAFINSVPRVDVLVQVAGIFLAANFLDADHDKIQRLVNVNVMGPSNVLQAGLEKMKDNGEGKIVVVASMAARRISGTWNSHYRMTKAATASILMSAAHEGAKHNINVNGIAPGYVVSGMFDDMLEYYHEQGNEEAAKKRIEGMVATIPLGRLQTNEDMANAAMFLSSDMAKNITGQLLQVDGGTVMQI